MRQPQPLSIAVDEKRRVSGLLQVPSAARVCYVLAHGAGAGMSHPFVAAVAEGLAERDIATLRYQFPYMEEGSKRPDTPKVAQATVRAAVAEASRLLPRLPIVAGGKSFGGRMTSQAQAASPLPGADSKAPCREGLAAGLVRCSRGSAASPSSTPLAVLVAQVTSRAWLEPTSSQLSVSPLPPTIAESLS